MSITDSQAEYGYVYYQNDQGQGRNSQGITLRETIVFNKLENFSIVLEDSDHTTKIETVTKKDENGILKT